MGCSWVKPNRCLKSKHRTKLVLPFIAPFWVSGKNEVLQVPGCSNKGGLLHHTLNTCCLFASHWPSSVLKPKPPTTPGPASLLHLSPATSLILLSALRLGRVNWTRSQLLPDQFITPTSYVVDITSHSVKHVTAKAKSALKVNRVALNF